MDYLVVTTPEAQNFWQIELLIESFKMLGIQDKLLVAMPRGDSLPRNLSHHKRKLYFENYDRHNKIKYPAVNKIIGIIASLGELNPIFTVLHTDMILVKETPITRHHNIVYNPQPIKKEVQDKLNFPQNYSWTGLNGTVKFESVPRKFFQLVVLHTHALLEKYGNEWPAALAAWDWALHNHNSLFEIAKMYVESELSSPTLLPIIHYRNGLPPNFSKKYYGLMRFGDQPFDCLLKLTHTPNTNYLRDVVLSYKK